MIYVYEGSRNEYIFCGENSKTLKLTHYMYTVSEINKHEHEKNIMMNDSAKENIVNNKGKKETMKG